MQLALDLSGVIDMSVMSRQTLSYKFRNKSVGKGWRPGQKQSELLAEIFNNQSCNKPMSLNELQDIPDQAALHVKSSSTSKSKS